MDFPRCYANTWSVIELSTRLYFDYHSPRGLRSLMVCSVLILGGLYLLTLSFNKEIFGLLNGRHSPVSDVFWLSWTTMGDGYLLGIVLGCFLVYNPRIAILGLATLLLSSVLVQVLKAVFLEPRPVEVLRTVHTVGPVLRFGSFPSGHSAAGMSLALTLCSFTSSRVLKGLMMTAAVLIGLSRVFVGAHFPLDVVAGMLTALLTFAFCATFLWPVVSQRVWPAPNWSSSGFKALYYLELLAGFGALSLYSPFYAESTMTGIVVSVVVMVAALRRYKKPVNSDMDEFRSIPHG